MSPRRANIKSWLITKADVRCLEPVIPAFIKKCLKAKSGCGLEPEMIIHAGRALLGKQMFENRIRFKEDSFDVVLGNDLLLK